MAENLKVYKDGTVEGTFHYVTDYTGFSSSQEEQEGYFFPFCLSQPGTQMTFYKNDIPVKEDIPWEADNVFRIAEGDTFKVEVNKKEIVTFCFDKAKWEKKKETVSKIAGTDLQNMTTEQIKALAAQRGYAVTAKTKGEWIQGFLKQQEERGC